MSKTHHRQGALLALAGTLASPAIAQSNKTAEYRITAETKSGLGGGMAAMLGGGGARHSLALQIASSERASAPQAIHMVPPALDLGKSVPLESPARATPGVSDGADAPSSFSPEKSPKLRIYWGCGETVATSQPRVLDAATIARQHGFGGTDVHFMRELSAATSTSYGEWPNAKSMREVKARASLVGDHLVQANYSAEMRFALGAGRDFLAPLTIAQQQDAAGAMRISWQGVDRSRAYFLSVMGQARDGAAVIWTSSAVPLSSFSMAGYLDRAELTRLLALKALLPADARQCTIPSAVMREIETPLLQMNALGEEATIAQPRPTTAPGSWRPAWSVMLRYRSDTMAMLGQPMPSLGATGGEEAPAVEGDKAPQRAKKRRGGLLGAAAGSLLGL